MKNTYDHYYISDCRVDAVSTAQVLGEVSHSINGGGKLTITALNPEKINRIWQRLYPAELFNSFDIVNPDSIGLSWAIKMLHGHGYLQRIPGDIIAPHIYECSKHLDIRIFLLGGEKGVARRAANNIIKHYPWVKITGTYHGYFSKSENAKVIRMINETGTNVIFVGMGAPYENMWIQEYKDRVNASVLITMGGYFDHIIRRIDCYPKFVKKLRINWLYRLCLEPKRLSRRYLLGNPRFLFRILEIKFSRRN